MKRNLFFFFFFINILYIYSQETRSICGTILQTNSSSPISFASISIKGKPLGTAANDLGQFTFHFQDNLVNDTLIISALGFKSYIKPIWSVIEDSITNFFLDTANVPLQPVLVLSKGETAVQIVKKAIERVGKNYPTKLYYIDAFYRELCMRDDKYARLVEAAISIQDFGYDTDMGTTKIKVNEIRKSDNYLEYDLYSKVFRKIYGDKNLILGAYFSDYVRGLQNCWYTNFLCSNNIDRYAFTLTDCNYVDKKMVYTINFRDTLFDSKIANRSSDIGGKIYIHADNYAIVKIEMGFFSINNSNQGKDYFYNNKYLDFTSIKYKEYNGKYYPDLIQTIRPVPNAMKTNSSDSIQGKQYILTTLLINNILTKRKEYSRIKEKEKEIPHKDIYEKKFPYHPEFWKNYNIVLLNPTIRSVNNDLERDKPLEEQFKNNAEQ